MRFLLIAISLFILTLNITAQKKSKFSGNTETYPEELRVFMQNLSEQHENTVELFLQAWQVDSVFDTSKQQDIIKFSQLLELKNGRPYPHFVNLLSCMLAIQNSKQGLMNYPSWLDAMFVHLESKKVNTALLNKLLEFSIYLFNENYIYYSASTRWRANSAEYTIVSDNGLFVDFEKTNLTCYIRNDSIELFETSGRADPENSKWTGKNGYVYWDRAGYGREDVFALLDDYAIDLTKSEYSADNVSFTNKFYLEKPLLGNLQDKVRFIKDPDDATYPKFFSHTKTFNINNIYKDINYTGGLSMQGAKLVGTGSVDNPARLFMFKNDTLVMVASSLYFGFKSDRVASERTAVSIKLGRDSIYHPDVIFTYRLQNRELTLQKSDNYSSLGPFFNSYHKVDMNFEQLTWKLDEYNMRFSAARGASIGKAYFESMNYFNYNKFLNLQLMDKVHPLISIRSFAQKYGSDEFPVSSYAAYLNMSVTDVKHMVMRMAFNGFVFYDSNTETVTVKNRLHEYIAASVNRIDYDVIGFSSNVTAPMDNGVFNLRTFDLTLFGIPQISVSDSQNVVIYPENEKIVLKENRNFQFDGSVVAGLMTFHGNNLLFHYDSFKINLQSIDYVSINYLTGTYNSFGFPVVDKVNNVLQDVTGELLIDNSTNKSGRVSYPEYPVFRSKETSFVYYNTLQNGVYPANSFYFALDPFEMDSLDNFNVRSMNFKGKFVSAGIFPEIRQELTLQPDNSLGFKHKTPSGGMPLFGDKGTFNNELWLSNNGLKGNGSIKYLTSTTWSDNFMFYPDSMNTSSQRFEVSRQTTATEYPTVRSLNNYIHWEPYNDAMWAYKTNTDFNIINDTTRLNGNLKLEPAGLSGSGRIDLKNSDLESGLFTFKSAEIFADTSDFYLKSLRNEGFTVLTENINSHINYRQGKGWFKSNEGYSLVTFPENKYISYIDYFIWDMSKKTLAMGSKPKPELPDYTNEDTEPEGPRFISTDPKQDSLSFVSPLAFYDYQANYINATGVKFIEVADARIYPHQGLVTVQPDFYIKTLEDARIIADTASKFHTLHTAVVNIEGRKTYYGSASYDFIDENGDTQVIVFKEIIVDGGGQTIARGDIFESDEFTLSPVYPYQGKALLFATDSLLTFNGATKINHLCDKLQPEWLNFNSRIEPNNIYIPVHDELKNIDFQDIYTGMFVYYDSVHIYPAFLTKRKNYSDKQMLKATGFLYFDKAAGLFKIGPKEKINNFTLPDNYVSLDRTGCNLYGEGNIQLGENLGQLKLNTYGNFRHNINENKTSFDLVMGINFPMEQNMVNLMGYEIDSFPDLLPVDITNMVIKKATTAWVGETKTREFYDELNLFGTIKNLPDQLRHTILLNELQLVWDDMTNSYHSVGKIGVASINGIQINKQVEGFFELRIKRSGDIMDLYLELDNQNYYYFGYTRGVMQTISSNRQYVETIMNMKTRDRKSKADRGETPYTYLISTDRKKDNFYARWKDIASGNTAGEEE